MTITITAFAASPDRGRGLARDMRVRWALEEVGQPYEVKLVSFAEMKQPDYLSLQPFGQIPAYHAGDLTLFETGAIVLHIAERFPGLFPADPDARARAIMWMFSAVTTIEQPILDREASVLTERDKDWHALRLPMLEERIRSRLARLSQQLGNADWLDGAFSAGDIMMVTVLRRLGSSGMLPDYPNLAAYIERAEARPAYRRAFAAQLKVFTDSQAGG